MPARRRSTTSTNQQDGQTAVWPLPTKPSGPASWYQVILSPSAAGLTGTTLLPFSVLPEGNSFISYVGYVLLQLQRAVSSKEVRANWSLFWDQVLLRSPNIVALIYKKAVKTFSTAFHWEGCEKPMEKPWGQFPCQREHYFLNEIISPVYCLVAAGRGEACAPAQRLALMVCGDGIKKSFTGLKTKPSPLTAP